MKKRDFITTGDFSIEELSQMIQHAISMKAGKNVADMKNKILTLIFANPSLRTRLSFASGMQKMGGDVNILSASDSFTFEYEDGVVMDGSTQEHIKDGARVLSIAIL